ncbi:MAG: sulfite exporter TauE/SafE family protein, partial [Chloroflexota bacterium]
HAEIRDARDVVQNPVVRWIRSVNVPPFISLPVSGIPRISIWVPIGVGFATGLLAGLLGVGGGFIRMPALIYLMGVPTVVAVGTDLFEIIISGSYGALTYALADRVDLLAAGIMLVMASAGVQIGVLATKYVRGDALREYFAWTILLAGVSVAMKQFGSVWGVSYLQDGAIWLLLASAGGISLLITVLYLKGYLNARSALSIEKRLAVEDSIHAAEKSTTSVDDLPVSDAVRDPQECSGVKH